MKKVYSKKLGGEVFALAPEQLEVFRNAGYQTPAPEEVIADAGAATLTPPEDKRAYVVLNLKSGEFAVRVRSCTLKGSEYSAVVGEIVQAGLLKRLAEQADPDRPKPAAPAAGAASPFVALFAEAIKKAFVGGTEATGQTAPAPRPPLRRERSIRRRSSTNERRRIHSRDVPVLRTGRKPRAGATHARGGGYCRLGGVLVL